MLAFFFFYRFLALLLVLNLKPRFLPFFESDIFLFFLSLFLVNFFGFMFCCRKLDSSSSFAVTIGSSILLNFVYFFFAFLRFERIFFVLVMLLRTTDTNSLISCKFLSPGLTFCLWYRRADIWLPVEYLGSFLKFLSRDWLKIF
jgi:hypothetical protein